MDLGDSCTQGETCRIRSEGGGPAEGGPGVAAPARAAHVAEGLIQVLFQLRSHWETVGLVLLSPGSRRVLLMSAQLIQVTEVASGL